MKAKTQKYKLKIPSITENLQMIREFVLKIAAKTGFNEETQEQIALAVDEACTNVIKHAHHHDARRLMDIQIQTDANKMKITITDKGRGFDITKLKDPDIEKFIKESRHGGLGIYLIKTLMDEVDYEFNPGVKNQVQLTKYLKKSVTS
ncbi:MAG: ATP-binding protein [Calditrichia bacterium]|jgi:serine/threonine-protein kinase RsbW|nr:ATP-binding protein [Calditrichia bacterium]